jgi:hypothetical protein
MSNVAEGRARGRWIRAVDEEYAPTGFGERPSDGAAHDAGANDGKVVRR